MARHKTKKFKRIRSWYANRKSPTGGTAKEFARYNKAIKILEMFAIPLVVFTFAMCMISKTWDVLNASFWMTFVVSGFTAAILLAFTLVLRIKRWNGYQKGFKGLIVPVIYLVLIWILVFEISWPYLMAAKQFHMYG